MNSIAIIPNKLFRLVIPEHDVVIILSLNQSYNHLSPYLVDFGLSQDQIKAWINEVSCCHNSNAITTAFPEENVIVIKMNYYDSNISRQGILVHELKHCAEFICDLYEMNEKKKLSNRRESEAYLLEWLYVDVMELIKPAITYPKENRDMSWFYQITHS